MIFEIEENDNNNDLIIEGKVEYLSNSRSVFVGNKKGDSEDAWRVG
jgi:hypothetical protein